MIGVYSSPEERRAAIRSGLEGLASAVAEAYRLRDWEHFGYETWADYVASFDILRLAAPERQLMAREMRDEGMSTRAIGTALGVDKGTVRNDLGNNSPPAQVVGTDGKSYPATKPVPPPRQNFEDWEQRSRAQALATVLRSVGRLAGVGAMPDFLETARRAHAYKYLDTSREELLSAIEALTSLSREDIWT